MKSPPIWAIAALLLMIVVLMWSILYSAEPQAPLKPGELSLESLVTTRNVLQSQMNMLAEQFKRVDQAVKEIDLEIERRQKAEEAKAK